MNRDIRMLILYKQHYMDQYKRPLTECQYSCWGYYDGMSIIEVNRIESRLFEKKSASPISELWYHAVENAKSLSGGYGEQNIGLFRCVSQETDSVCKSFWDRNRKMPYFAIAFLQLLDKQSYDAVRSELEQLYQEENEQLKYNLLAYCSFDNADLVVLVQANNIKKIGKILGEIERRDDVAYLHPVMGVSEEYLKVNTPDFWKGIDCHLNEQLPEIRISIVSSGRKEIVHWIRKQLSKIFPERLNKISCFAFSGHENLIVRIPESNVKELISLLVEKGFATQQNVLYENGIYNIQTSICTEEKTLLEVAECELPKEKEEKPDGWCKQMIERYRNYFSFWRGEGNESMYSYYQALLQTLNTLAQYEEFQLANNIFYQLYPSFAMFLEQLDDALEKVEQNKKSNNAESGKMMEKIKESVCQYLESVNSVMYHTTHTDQMFLMIPGYSGTTFSIPVKLSLLYSWLCNQVIKILNDSTRKYKYQCLLTPVMESKPGTDPISFGLGHGDRLVRVKLSQRSLYMPRDLMIILTHEIAHYVGEDIRLREYRLAEIIRALTALIIEGILPKDYKGNLQTFDDFYSVNRKEMQRYIISILEKRMKENCRQNGYHASYIDEELKTACREVLANEGCGLQNIIYKIPRKTLERIDTNSSSSLKEIKSLRQLQEKCDRNRKRLLISGDMDKIVPELIRICREVFSDTAALAILNFDLQTFQEASDVSEGVFNEEKYDERQSARKEVLNILLSGGQKEKSELITNNGLAEDKQSLYYNLYAYDCTKNLLERYANNCYIQLKERVKKKQSEVDAVQKVFHMFTGEEKCSCSQIFAEIYKRINEYIEEVKQSYYQLIN